MQQPNHKGSAMVMALTLVLTFATIAIAMNELVIQQTLEIEFLGARVQTEYAALAGLTHGQVKLAEDLTTNFTINPELLGSFRHTWCVEWFSNQGLKQCNTSANPETYCCAYAGGQCKTRPVNGVCNSENQWRLSYISRYDGIEKSIISSGIAEFINEDLEVEIQDKAPLQFSAGRQMRINWE